MTELRARRRWVGAVVTAVVTAVAIASLAPEPSHTPSDTGQAEPAGDIETAFKATSGKLEVVAEPANSGADPGPDGLTNLPASLRGTAVDGQLRADDQGHLVINHDVRRVFDYFLSAVGEESPEQLLNRIRLYLADQLPPAAVAEAEQILFDYLSWQEAAGQQGEQSPITDLTLDPDWLEFRLTQSQALQAQYLGPDVAEAFFGDENRYNDYMVQKLRLQARDDLSPEARSRQLELLESALIPGQHQVMSRIRRYQVARQQTKQLQDTGATAADIYQARASVLGDEAASRLQELDQQRENWQQRMKRWLQQRQQLMAKEGLDDGTLNQYLDSRRRQYFSDTELRRVQALERIHDQNK